MSHKMDQQVDTWSSTKHQLVKFTHRWEIENMNFYSQCIVSEGVDRPLIESPKFSSPNYPALQFKFTLHPKGESEASNGCASLFLYLVSCLKALGPKPDVRVQCKMSIIDQQDFKRNSASILTKLRPNKSGWGFLKYITQEKLKSLLVDDKLIIFCEIEAILNTIHTTSSLTTNKMETQIDSQVLDNFGELFESRKFTDFVLISRDSTEHRAHKAILAARSPVFCAMFEHDTTERNQGRVLIDDIDGDVISEMLRFLYTGKVLKLNELADRLLIAADKYALDQLKSLCEQSIIANVNCNTAVPILVLADKHSAKQLRAKAIEFINANLSEIIKTDSWNAIKDQTELYFELFSKLLVGNLK